MKRLRVTATIAAILAGTAAAYAEAPANSSDIHVDSVLITLIEQVDVPAREAGVLTHVEVHEGQLVDEGAFIAQIDNREATLAAERAQIEIDIAKRKAENDVNVRFARKSTEVAQAELKRALEAVDLFRKSISETEIDRLRLAAERAELEIEQSTEQQETDKLTHHLKQNEYKQAVHKVENRKVVAPLSGAVVEVNRHAGEWVEPGDPVVRILRVDRLRAEAFIDAALVTEDLAGSLVTLSVDLPNRPAAEFRGRLVFVSPEVNPVNGQVRIWAEIENQDLRLRPGMQASMTIEAGGEELSDGRQGDE